MDFSGYQSPSAADAPQARKLKITKFYSKFPIEESLKDTSVTPQSSMLSASRASKLT